MWHGRLVHTHGSHVAAAAHCSRRFLGLKLCEATAVQYIHCIVYVEEKQSLKSGSKRGDCAPAGDNSKRQLSEKRAGQYRTVQYSMNK